MDKMNSNLVVRATQRLLLGFFLFSLILTSCSKEEEKTYVEANRVDKTLQIKGKVRFPSPKGGIDIFRLDPFSGKPVFLMTKAADKQGNFEFKITVPEPTYFAIQVYKKQVVPLLLNKSDVYVEVDGTSEKGFREVKGCRDTDLYYEYLEIQKDAELKREKLPPTESEPLILASVEKFIDKAKGSVAAIMGTNLIEIDDNMDLMKKVKSNIEASYPNSPYLKSFAKNIAKAEKLLKGKPAPDFELQLSDSSKVKLSDFRGKYVLLDFSRYLELDYAKDNALLSTIYAKHKDSDLEIITVSMDRTILKWDTYNKQIVWKKTAGFLDVNKPIAELYAINEEQLPRTFLINPEGIIVAKNIRGTDLEPALVALQKK